MLCSRLVPALAALAVAAAAAAAPITALVTVALATHHLAGATPAHHLALEGRKKIASFLPPKAD